MYTRGMTLCMRKIMTWLTVLTLVVTGHAMAIAQGMPGVAGYAELCIGHEPVMVTVDAEGNPTGESHICPEFGLSLLNAVTAGETHCAAPDSKARKAVGVVAVTAPVIRAVQTSARAPPMAV